MILGIYIVKSKNLFKSSRTSEVVSDLGIPGFQVLYADPDLSLSSAFVGSAGSKGEPESGIDNCG